MENDKIARKASHVKDELTKDAEQAKKFTKKKIQTLKARGKNMESTLENKAYALGEKARNALEQAENLVNDGSDYVETKAKERPFITIGVSLLIGMLLAKLGSNGK